MKGDYPTMKNILKNILFACESYYNTFMR